MSKTTRCNQQLGFIGFGEAAFNIAQGLRQANGDAVTMYAYDLHTHTPQRGALIQQRAAICGCILLDSVAELAQTCPTLISLVTADSALDAVIATAPHLLAHHLYADFNSVSPKRKKAIAEVVTQTGSNFVEVAVMASVPPYAHRVPLLMNGDAAESLAQTLRALGMQTEVMSGEIGAAAAVKMCRSIVIKGMEAILFECILGACEYGAETRVFASLQESYPGIQWDELASYMVGRAVVHGERRAREMEEVANTLREADIEPIMAQAIAQRHDWAAKRLRSHFDALGPKHYHEVVAVLNALKAT
jgi:3-hydroxyisobutyrate dehydrogenase-like beta-hydroxyacid dehydrogenase